MAKVRCRTCLGSGYFGDISKKNPCQRCHGTGLVEDDSPRTKVICTELARQGRLESSLHAAWDRYAADRWDQATFAGYYSWALPFVQRMRRRRLLSGIAAYFVVRRARYVAYCIGARSKGSAVGWMVAAVVDGGSRALGHLLLLTRRWKHSRAN